MLTINASSQRPTLNDAMTVPTPAGNGSSDPAGFSSLLRQSQAASPPKEAAPPPALREDAGARARAPDHTQDQEPARSADDDAAASAESGEPAANDVNNHNRTLLKSKLRGSDAAMRAAKPGTDAAVDNKPVDKPAGDTTAAANPSNTRPAQLDPNIAQWLAALQRPAPAATTTDGDRAAADAAAAALGEAAAPRRGAHGELPGADPKGKTDREASRFALLADAAGVSAAQAEARTTEAAAAAPNRTIAATDNVIATPMPAVAAAPRDIAAPASVSIPTRVDAPDFAQVLGMQMSVLAKDGVQRAELHLNPADMGPVSVQIVMDGTQARVDFGADVAATRHAIEAGLPELASALRDAGFTLAGGGVSQHSGSRGGQSTPDDDTRRGARRASDDSVARVSTAARRIVTNGGLDLYA